MFTITNHLYFRAPHANAVVCRIATDVFTPESIGGISRELLASHLEKLEPGESLSLEPLPFTGGRVRDVHAPVVVMRVA